MNSIKPINLRNESGFALVTTLMVLSTLTLMLMATVMNAATEMKLCRDFKMRKSSLYWAESGIEEARGRLRSIRETGTFTKDWRAFIGEASKAAALFGYDSENSNHFLYDSLQEGMTYTAAIRHQTEADIGMDLNGDGDMNDVVLWGDTDGDYSSEKNPGIGVPVDLIWSEGAFANSWTMLSVETRRGSLFPDPPGAIYVDADLNKNGSAGWAVGSYPGCTPKPDVITTPSSAAGYEASDWSAGTSTPSWLVDDETDVYPINETVQMACASADAYINSGNNQTFGSSGDPYKIYCSNGDWSGNNLDGYGILAINGNFVTGGNIGWHGIIFVTGTATLNGGGHQSIYGAFLAGGSTTINGTPDVYYDCQEIAELADLHSSYQPHGWQDVSLTEATFEPNEEEGEEEGEEEEEEEEGPACGDDTCDPGEDACSCPGDCGYPPTSEFICGDGVDEDCDGQTDCDDADCFGDYNCSVCGDGMCDAYEDTCACPDDCGSPPTTELSCGDGGDEDCDGLVDCSDPDCSGDPVCSYCGDGTCDPTEDTCSCAYDCGTPPSMETSCGDGADEDCDGQTDCDDSDCSGDSACGCLPKWGACSQDSDCCSVWCHKGECK